MNDEFLNKYEFGILKGINPDNMANIIDFLINEGVDYIEEIIDNYLDLFLIESAEFKTKFNLLKEKYGSDLVAKISEDLSILEDLI